MGLGEKRRGARMGCLQAGHGAARRGRCRVPRLLWWALVSYTVQLAWTASDVCPDFASTTDTVVETAPGCENVVEIPFTLKGNVWQSTTIAILDTRPPGSTLEVRKQAALISDASAGTDSSSPQLLVAILRWTPQLEHAGLPREFDVKISSTAPECESYAHTVTFRVYKCEYCVSDKESMHSIAARFDTHWTQLWSPNHELETPDQLQKGKRIKLGNFYQTVAGDTWKLMAVRFGTTVKRLMDLNPDLAADNADSYASPPDNSLVVLVPPDTNVCVMPETCPERRERYPGVTW